MGPISNFFLLLPLTLSISLQLHQVFANDAASSGTDLITKTCENSVYKDLCVTSLRSDPTSKNADLAGLASITIKLAVNQATETSQRIEELLTSTTDPFDQQCLSDCSENYIDAVDQLEDSLAALDSKGYNDVSTWVQAAMSDAETCEDGFKEQPGHVSLLSNENTNFSHLCSNVLAITNSLAGI